MKPKRIRSQITWESEEQKAAFLRYIGDRGYTKPREYLRALGNQQLEIEDIDEALIRDWRDIPFLIDD